MNNTENIEKDEFTSTIEKAGKQVETALSEVKASIKEHNDNMGALNFIYQNTLGLYNENKLLKEKIAKLEADAASKILTTVTEESVPASNN